MNNPINWNEVTVGETEIVNPSNDAWLVVCRHEEKVWLYRDGLHQTRHESSLDKWTIYDPWVDVSEECTISSYGTVMYEGVTISFFDFQCGKFKRSEKGLRIWKRKEGRDE